MSILASAASGKFLVTVLYKLWTSACAPAEESKGGSHGLDTSFKAATNPAFQSVLISLYLGHYYLLTYSLANWKQ